MRSFLLYAVVRLGLWVLIWWLLTLMGLGVAVAGVAAALLAMLISILALEPLRNAAAMRWKDAHEARVAKRGEVHDEDAEFEDAVLDEAETTDPGARTGPEDPDGPEDQDGPAPRGDEEGPGAVRGSDR